MTKLFAVGHGRSGTTILLNALNTSPDIYLLGECSFYRDRLPDFRVRYNQMHEQFGNQPNKSSYAPRLAGLDEHANSAEYLNQLASIYKYAGEKIALSPMHNAADIEAYLESECPNAPIIWTLRQPRFSLASTAIKFNKTDLDNQIIFNIRSILFLIKIARTRTRVYICVYETITQQTFDFLSEQLDVDLSQAGRVYSNNRSSHSDWGRDSEFSQELEFLDRVYDELVQLIDPEMLRIPPHIAQVEQKLPSFDAVRPNALGTIVRDLMNLEASMINLNA